MKIIIYDFGTSSVKTCLFEIGSGIELVASAAAGYALYISDDGGSRAGHGGVVGGSLPDYKGAVYKVRC